MLVHLEIPLVLMKGMNFGSEGPTSNLIKLAPMREDYKAQLIPVTDSQPRTVVIFLQLLPLVGIWANEYKNRHWAC